MIRKLLAWVLSIMMLVSMVPVQVLAAPSAFSGMISVADDPVYVPEELEDDSADLTEETQEDGQEQTASELPNALVTELGALTLTPADHNYMVWPSGDSTVDRPLNMVLNFKAIDSLDEANAGGYADYKTDFYLTFDGLSGESITADGCYLAGNYGSYGWIVIPVDGLKVEKGVDYPVVSSYDANLTYREICDSVKDFTAALYITDEILEDNPNLKVNLELRLTSPDDSSEVLVIGKPLNYDVDTLKYEAMIGSKGYETLEEAVVAVEAGIATEIKLLKAVALEESIEIAADKVVTLDLNGKTITGTPTEKEAYYVISNKGTLTIDDSVGGGAIVCDHKLEGSTAYAVNAISNHGTLTIEGGKIENKSTAAFQIGYAIDNYSGSANAVVVINGGEITASGSNYYDGVRLFANSTTNENSVAVNGGTVSTIWTQNPSANDANNVKASVEITDGTVNALYLEPSSAFTASVTGGHIGKIAYNSTTNDGRDLTGFVEGGTFDSDPAAFVAKGYEAEANADGTYGVVANQIFEFHLTDANGDAHWLSPLRSTDPHEALEIAKVWYESLQGTYDFTLEILDDYELEDTLVIDFPMTIDLNGHTLSQSKECTASYEMISNKSTLTIKDSVGGGKISFTDTSAGDPTFGWGSYTIRNEGTLVVDGGTIEHLGQQNQGSVVHMYCAIFQYSGSTTINGGTISTPTYRSVRLWKGDMTINGGTFEGQVWVQAVDNTSKLTINGGSFAPRGVDGSSVFVSNASYDVEFAVTDGTFETKIGASDATKLAGAITGGKFTVSAKENTNAALISDEVEFGELGDDGYYTLVDFNYVEWVQEQLFEGNDVKLDRDIVITDYDLVHAHALPSNGNGKYNEVHGNGAIFHIIKEGVVLDLNGHSITWDAHHDDYCNKRQVSLFMVTITGVEGEKSDFTVVDTSANKAGKVDVYGMGSGMYVVGVNAKGVLNGGTWTNYPCKTCGASNIFFYPSHGGVLEVKDGKFEQVGSDYLFGCFGATGETTGNSVGVDYDQTKIVISGGTFVDFDPEEIKFIDFSNGGAESDANGCENGFAAEDNGDGTFGIKPAIEVIVDGTFVKDVESLADAVQYFGGNAVTLKLNNDVELGAAFTYSESMPLTIDLNGHTLSYTSDIVGEAMITNNGDLTITDSTDAKDGKIVYTYTGEPDTAYSKGNYTINNEGKLTLEAGTIENATAKMSHACYAVDNKNELVVNGGKILNTNNYAVRQFESGNNKNTVTVTGGEIEGTRAVWMQAAGSDTTAAPAIELTVTGGKLTALGENGYTLAVYSYTYGNSLENVKVEVSGDAVIDGDIALTGGKNKTAVEKVTVTGGTLTDLYSYADDELAKEAITITGGTFKTNYAEMYALDDGYKFEDNGDGTFGVQPNKIFKLHLTDPTTGEPATIPYLEGTDLASLVATGKLFYANYYVMTLEILDNCEIDETVVVDYPMTIDLKGHTITNVIPETASVFHTITNNSDLTVIDSVGGGEIRSNSAKGYVIYTEGGKLTVDDAKIVGINNGYALVTWTDGDSITVKEGTVVEGRGALYVDGGATGVVDGGTFTMTVQTTNNQDNVVYVGGTSELTINGGTFSTGSITGAQRLAVAALGTSKVTINDGTFYGLTGDIQSRTSTGNVSVKGGTFTGTKLDERTADSIAVKGGTFSYDPTEYLADGYVVTETNGKYTVYEKVELPEVVITDIKSELTANDPDLTFALNFAIKDLENLDEEYLENLFAQYGDWYVDYVLTIEGLTDSVVTFNANGDADGYLAGQYEAWSENWVSVPFEDVTVQNGESLYIMEYAAKLMGQSGLRFTLAEVATIVQNFDCGVYFTPEFIAANPGLKVTLELKVFTEDAEGNKINDISVATNNFDVEDIVAIVTGTNKQTEYYTTFADAYNGAEADDTITLLKDVTLTGKLTIAKAVTIDGNGHSIIADETAVWYTGSGFKKTYIHLIGVNKDGITLKNVVLDCNNNAAGINAYCAQNVVFDNVSIINATKGMAALTVNGTTLTFKNAFTALGNAIALDISNGTNVTSALGVTVEEGTVFNLDNKTVKFASEAVNDMSGAVDANGAPYFAAKDVAYFYTQAQIDSRTTAYSNGLTLLADVEFAKDYTIGSTLDLGGHNLTVAEGKVIKISGKLTVTGGTPNGAFVLTSEGATLTAPEGLDVTTTVADARVVYADGEYSVKKINYVAKLGDDQYFESVTAALDAAYNAGMKDIVITLIGETNASTTDSVDLYGKYGNGTAFNTITFKQEDASKTYYLFDLYTGWTTGKVVFDGVNVTVTEQFMLIGKVELINNSTITRTNDITNFVFDGDAYIEPGSKIVSQVDSLRSDSMLTVDGGHTDGTINSAADYKTVWITVDPGNTLTIKNGAYVIASNYEFAKLAANGTVEVLDSRLDVFTTIEIGANGVLKVNKNSVINTPKITGTGKIVIDVTDMEVGVVKAFESADLSGFTGVIELINNSNEYEAIIVEGKVTLIEANFVAQIGNTQYKTLQAAIDAAQPGDTITVIADHELEVEAIVESKYGYETLVLIKDKNVTLDFNGKTVSVNLTSTANMNGGLANTLEAVIFLDNAGLTIVGEGGFKVTGGDLYSLIYNCGSALTIKNGIFDIEKTVASGSIIYAEDQHTTNVEGGSFKLGNAGENTDTKKPWMFNVEGKNSGVFVNVTGGTYNQNPVINQFTARDCEVNIPKEKAVKDNGDGTWTVVDSEVYIEVVVSGYTYEIGFASLEEAIAAADGDDVIKLFKNISRDYSVKVEAGKDVVLDLAGYTFAGTDNATSSFGLITNTGNLTIKDSVGGGKITLTATNNRGWTAYSSVISNTVGGKLTVEDGTLEHLGGTDMAYGIDNLTNGKGTYAETVVNGGTIKSKYRGIRQFLNGIEAQNILTITGGTVEGTNKSVWMQDPSKNANTGTLTVGENATLKGDVYLTVTEGSTEWPVEVSIAAAALNDTSEVITNANVPAGYALELVDGAYTVTKWDGVTIKNVQELIWFRDAVNAGNNYAGKTVTLVADSDLAGIDWSVNIGDDCNATFDGIFDGNNKTIYNLTSTETEEKSDGYICTGLFGAIYGSAQIKNLTLDTVNIDTGDYVGNNVAAVVGFAYSCKGSVENVTVKNVTINAKNVTGVGAIVGYDYYGDLTVKNCSVQNGAITGAAYVGGIIGYASNKADVVNCSVDGLAIKATSCAVAGVAGILLAGGTVSGSTVKNVTVSADHANWQNSAAVVVGTITGKVTVSGTTAESVNVTAIVGSEHKNQPTEPVKKVEARIGDNYYVTFTAALADANDGETIVLLTDVADGITVDKAVVVDTNGNNSTAIALENIDATVKGVEGLNVTTTVAGYEVDYANNEYKLIPFVRVAAIGDVQYKTLAAAIAAAKAGDTITLLADIVEDVAVAKSITIDGANYKYTGNISVSGNTSKVTVKNVNFVDGTGYAITTNRISSITVEDCTVTNYGYGFLYANKSTPTVVVKNVTVDGGNYGFHWVYGTSATLENVTMTNVTNGLLIQNYAGKTITLKNCNLPNINVWERDGKSGVQTFKFLGANTVSELSASQYAKYVLGEVNATLTAPENITVNSGVEGYKVKYENGTHSLYDVRFEIKFANLALGSSLEMFFYVEQADVTGEPSDYYAEIRKTYADGREDVVETVSGDAWSTLTSGGVDYYRFSFKGIAAKEMTDNLYVTVYNNDGSVASYVREDSVEKYAHRAFATGNLEVKTMLVDMLYYGAEAQKYFKYNESNLATANLTETEKMFASSLHALNPNYTYEDDEYYWYGNTLVLESEIDMMVYFLGYKIKEGMYVVTSYTDHYGHEQTKTHNVEDLVKAGDLLGAKVDLVVADARQIVTSVLYDADDNVLATVKASIEGMTYVVTYPPENVEVDEREKALYQSIMRFSDSAYAYFH